jgi:carbamoyl-phosphate synthase large subunit
MPRRDDIRTILILGSGPIVIGQGCEFDYSGTQACKALRAEGYRVVLVNSNPATIMTDPAFSDRTYIEPITPESVAKIFEAEIETGHPIDAILPTLGGQTALNCACQLHDDGTLERFGVEMIGASREVIHRAEDRSRFTEVCRGIGLATPTSRTVCTIAEAVTFLEEIGLPAIIRPAFTLGGWGGGIAYNTEEYRELVARGIAASMIGQVQIDQSLLGWKEYELEVVRDKNDNCIVVCGIENFDPMGVHTGDSITVAPILTLSDKEYQVLRDAAFAVMRAVGVETGGSNVQFAINPNPDDGRFAFVVVEMNPRVSRSSALASKATGFPIAKIAARLAVGYTLDELGNDITGTTSACFEPAIDYVVTKLPRWTFEKFPEADETLTTQMKSVGEAMAIGRTFKESLQKVIRSMEVKRFGLGLDRNDKWLAAMRAFERDRSLLNLTPNVEGMGRGVASKGGGSSRGPRTADGQAIEWPIPLDKLTRKIAVPCQGRLYYIRYALKMGWTIEKINDLSGIDPFFLDQIAQLVEFEDELCSYASLDDVPSEVMLRAKQLGYSDAQLANLYLGTIKSETILRVRARRKQLGVEPVYKLVDTCAAEFEASTPYYYSTYEQPFTQLHGDPSASEDSPAHVPDDEVRVTDKPKVIILGGGPNRIGQGIEFDYCCVHAAFAARELGFESVMINSNPETVSTDYDTSDLLFFEPLTLEDTLNVIEKLNGGPLDADGGWKPPPRSETGSPRGLCHGVIVQFGGQTPLNLAGGLAMAGAPIIGTSLDSIDLAEDRDRFDALLGRLGLQRPEGGIARSLDEALAEAARIGYPVLVRPSYVLGGRGMEICPDEAALRHYIANALDVSEFDDAPVLIDKFLDGATEVDVDVIADFDPAGDPHGQGAPATEGAQDSRLKTQDSPRALICGVMEHIEHAGVHSGDSSCTIPPWSLDDDVVTRIRDIARRLAEALHVNGLMNVQMAVKGGRVYILEVNPRASRTVPFVGKAKHVPWASLAAKVMMGRSLSELGAAEAPAGGEYAVKEPVFPFQKFPRVDFVLGPEMRSTGEVMGIDASLPIAFAKGLLSSGVVLPGSGGVFVSVRDADKDAIIGVARRLDEMGFELYATHGTAEALSKRGIMPRLLQKVAAGARPNVIDLMADGHIGLVINTPTRTGWQTDEGKIRATAVRLGVPMITTATAADAAVRAIEALRRGDWGVRAMQDYARHTPTPVSHADPT